MEARTQPTTTPAPSGGTGRRIAGAFGWGVLATVVMSAIMIAGVLTGLSPMPKPIPAAIVGKLLGPGLAKPALIGLAAVLHLAYGGFWAALLAAATQRVTVWKGLGLGVTLWLLMQVAVLPWLGWGLFGVGQTPKIAVATLVLHLVYGATLGALAGRGKLRAAGAP